jgi:acetyltransferase-like isoleucine patch superfamily enzyme
MSLYKKLFVVPPYMQVNRLLRVFAVIKTKCWYALFFKHIGRGTVIYKPSFISNPQHIWIGDNVSIRCGLRIETLINTGVTPNLTIGNNTNIEQNVHIICRNNVHIGNDVTITANCAIVDTTHPYAPYDPQSKIGNRISEDSSSVIIEDNVFLGIGVIILPNVKIGAHSVIGANSVVSISVPAASIAAGAPAKIIKSYNCNTKKWTLVND